jgi:transposase
VSTKKISGHVYIKPGMPGRRRRRYTEEFKAKVAEECRRAGVSIASVALANSLNANLLRKWVAEREGTGSPPPALPPLAASEEFVALPLIATPKSAEGSDIRIELRRGAMTVTITWPAQAAGDCAAWLREWLR